MSIKKESNTFLIKKLIFDAKQALSHQDIQNYIEGKCNRVTIYRILDKLIAQGDIHKVIDVSGVSKFAACSSCAKEKHNHEHIHFSCTVCLAVTCLNHVALSFQMPSDYSIQDTNFTISGICPACQ